MIYTTYFSQLKNLPRNMTWVSICRTVPRWYRGRRCKLFMPSFHFFMNWRNTHDAESYTRQYKAGVLDQTNIDEAIGVLSRYIPRYAYQNLDGPINKSQNWHIALVCYEKPSDFCHRHLVAQWLRDNGVECKEW